jgi:hypothetical protein
MPRDFVLGCGMLAFSGVYYLLAGAIPSSLLDDAIGPQGLPKAYALLLACLSSVQIIRSLARRSEREPSLSVPWSSQLRAVWRALGMLMIGAAYLVIVPWLGYVPSIAALIFVTILYQHGVGRRRAAAVAVSGALFFWLLFVLLLGIPQPRGFWASLF